jgi:hypothetical protein
MFLKKHGSVEDRVLAGEFSTDNPLLLSTLSPTPHVLWVERGEG